MEDTKNSKDKKLQDWMNDDWQNLGLESFAEEWNRTENESWDECFHVVIRQNQEGSSDQAECRPI